MCSKCGDKSLIIGCGRFKCNYNNTSYVGIPYENSTSVFKLEKSCPTRAAIRFDKYEDLWVGRTVGDVVLFIMVETFTSVYVSHYLSVGENNI